MPNVLLSDALAVEFGAEPWPDDAKLFQSFEVEQMLLPDSANSRSVQAFLKIVNLGFDVVQRSNAEQMSPSGQIPFVKCGAHVVAEMDAIVAMVNNKGISASYFLDTNEKADMQAYISLVDNVFNSAELAVCWGHEETLKEVTIPRYSFAFPWPLDKWLCRKKGLAVKAKLASVGWGDKSFIEVLSEVEDCCQALSERLNNRPYFFGDKPTELDALVYGHLSAILATPLPDNSLAAIITEHETLVDLCKRFGQTYFNSQL